MKPFKSDAEFIYSEPSDYLTCKFFIMCLCATLLLNDIKDDLGSRYVNWKAVLSIFFFYFFYNVEG